MTTIVDVISETVTLAPRSDGTYSGHCPFCGADRRLVVYLNTQTYRCFRCNASGDAFSFIMQRDGVDFRTAARRLMGKDG